MAEEIGSAAGKAAGKAALKSFMNPSIDVVKTVQGIVELVLRGSGAVGLAFEDVPPSCRNHSKIDFKNHTLIML